MSTPSERVDSLVQSTLLSPAARQSENNLKFVGDRLTQGTRDIRRVLRTYRSVLQGKPVKDVPASPVHTSLRLSGVVKPDAERRLQVRNRVYRQVFCEPWVREKMPADMRLIVGAAAAVLLFAIFSVWYLAIFPQPYIQNLETASNDVEVAYKNYDGLHKPFHRAQADDLLAQFFERRDERDKAILLRARAGDGVRLASLVGRDYPLLRRMVRLGGIVTALSTDGKLAATASAANTVRVFETPTGQEVFHQNAVLAVAFSPDGKLVATGDELATTRVFEASTGREISRLAHKDTLDAVAFSPDGKLVVTASVIHTVRVFEAATGREVSRLAHDDWVRDVVFSLAGKLVATRSADYTAGVFEVPTGRGVSRLAHQDVVYAVAFSPDGTLVATGSADHTARLFEAATGREVSRLAHDDWVRAVGFRPRRQTGVHGLE